MAHSDDPAHRYRRERERITALPESEAVAQATADRILEVLDALDPDRPDVHFPNGANVRKTTIATRTREGYGMRLRLAAIEFDGPLIEQDNDSINTLMAALAVGEADAAPDDGYAKGVVGQYQSALKAFYRYHDGHDVDPEAIPVMASESAKIDDRDMFTAEEVKGMRKVIDHPRERCIFELLAYSGQRTRVIQTLRIKDVDVTEGVFWINDQTEDRKGAEGKRPLLGAKEYVRQWLEYHPTGEPNDALITPLAGNGGNGTPGEPMSQNSIRYQLNKIAEKAGVEKAVHPHIFRHYFTTIAKRRYEMDDAHIKRLRGDAPGSNVMETTYQHLSDEDAIKHAEEKAGIRESEDTGLTPETCPTCGIVLDPGAKACTRCGSVFTPDAQAAKETVHQDVGASKVLAGLSEGEITEDDLQAIAENDALLAKLIEIRAGG